MFKTFKQFMVFYKMDRPIVSILFLTLLFTYISSYQGSELMVKSVEDSSLGFVPCSNDTDCETFTNGICVDNFCDCNGTKFCNDDKTGTKVTKLGEICKIKADCNIEHSVCKHDKCTCEDGRVGTRDGRRCLKVADGLGSTCEDSIQCYTKVPRSGCHHEKCVCQQQTHQYDEACYYDIALGESCTQPGDCTNTPFAKCDHEKCTCKKGYVPNALVNKCLEVAKRMSDACYEDIQCYTKHGNAVCKLGYCQCEELYQYKAKKEMCVRDLLLGEICENHTDCHGLEQGDSRLECVLGQCKCKSEYYEEMGFCASAAAYLVHVPTVLVFFMVGICVYLNDNVYVFWCSFIYSIFYMLWITTLGRYFFHNNNYLDNTELHEE